MPDIAFTFTYTHSCERSKETTSIIGKCDFEPALLSQLKKIADKLQGALNQQQLHAMKIGNNFFITHPQNGDEYISVSLNRLLVDRKHATSAIKNIDDLITRIHQAEQHTINSNRLFKPIEHGENQSTPTPPLRA